MKKTIMLGMILILSLLIFAGCSDFKSFQMVNELRFSLDGISNLTISYDEENITFYEADSDEFIIKEYMTKNKSSYYAKITLDNADIRISEGGKPLLGNGFARYVEIYLPKTYHKNLTVTSTKGDIDFSGMNLDVSVLRVDNSHGNVVLEDAIASDIYLSSTDGLLDIGSLQADQIKLETTSGNVDCAALNGNVTYTTTSGNADIKSAMGSGSYRANNLGQLSVTYKEINGNLSFYNKNDNIKLVLPENLEFELEAITKNGSVVTNFQQDLFVDGRTTSGTVGDHPTVTILAETNNGNIEVQQ